MTYEQATGRLYDDSGNLLGVGYSGHGAGRNNPDAQTIHSVGPIPQGVYTVSAPRDTTTHGPFVLPLTPDLSNRMFSRGGFLMHGDSVHAPGTASEGCIIMVRPIREAVWASGDRRLTVVSGLRYLDMSTIDVSLFGES